MPDETMIEGPYYIVEEGTSKRTFKNIYDTAEIAQGVIDRFAKRTTSLEDADRVKHVPISIEEYNAKYTDLI